MRYRSHFPILSMGHRFAAGRTNRPDTIARRVANPSDLEDQYLIK